MFMQTMDLLILFLNFLFRLLQFFLGQIDLLLQIRPPAVSVVPE